MTDKIEIDESNNKILLCLSQQWQEEWLVSKDRSSLALREGIDCQPSVKKYDEV